MRSGHDAALKMAFKQFREFTGLDQDPFSKRSFQNRKIGFALAYTWKFNCSAMHFSIFAKVRDTSATEGQSSSADSYFYT